MARKHLTNLDLNLNELQNFKVQLLASDPGSPPDGQVWINTTTGLLKARIGGVTYSFGRLDQLNTPTADVGLGGRKITGLADGVSASDAATVGQVSASSAGLDVKQSVRVASTGNVSVASPGASIDGVSLTAGDRVLLKNQTTGSENGIYVWNGAAVAMTRATDADANAEVTSGLYVWVEEGTANADTGWFLTTNNPIVVGTTALTFAKFAAAGTGLGKFAQNVGDGSATSIAVTHNLGTTDVLVQVRQNSDGAVVEPDLTVTSSNVVTLGFAVAPASAALRVVVVG